MKHVKTFENLNESAKEVTWHLTTPITSIKSSDGVEFKVGDMARVKDYHPKYEKITKIELNLDGSFIIYLDNYEIPKNPNEIEKQ